MGDKCARSHTVEVSGVHRHQVAQSGPPGLGSNHLNYAASPPHYASYAQTTATQMSRPSPVYYSVQMNADSHSYIVNDTAVASLRPYYDFEENSHLTILFLADGRPTAESAQLDALLGTPCTLHVTGYAVSPTYVVLSVEAIVDERSGRHMPYFGNVPKHVTLATKNRAALVNAPSAFQNGKYHPLQVTLRGLLDVTRYK